MTAIEVFNEITSVPKWYAGYTTAQNAYNIKKRFEAKKLDFNTLKSMFNHYGYVLTGGWVKEEKPKVDMDFTISQGNKIANQLK